MPDAPQTPPASPTPPNKWRSGPSKWTRRKTELRRARRQAQKQLDRGEERSRALNLAQQLQFLADDPVNHLYAPELRRIINKIRIFGGRSHDADVVAVMKAIKYRQCNSVYDICEETDIPQEVVEDLIAQMIEAGAAEERPRESRGPRQMLIYLTGNPFEDFVA
jgi:hypothetical protein